MITAIVFIGGFWLGFFCCALLTINRREPEWEGKIDKKTTTFENGCYFGLERRHKLDAIIESLKLNDVDYTERVKQPLFRGVDRRKQKNEVDAAVHQRLEDKD